MAGSPLGRYRTGDNITLGALRELRLTGAKKAPMLTSFASATNLEKIALLKCRDDHVRTTFTVVDRCASLQHIELENTVDIMCNLLEGIAQHISKALSSCTCRPSTWFEVVSNDLLKMFTCYLRSTSSTTVWRQELGRQLCDFC